MTRWVAAIAWLSVWSLPAQSSADFPVVNREDFSPECRLCHNNDAGGLGCATPPCLNPFGMDFQFAGGWGPWLAYQDSDGDGWLNGQELGDPNGNDAPGGGNYNAVSAPGNAGGGLPNTPPGGTIPVSMCSFDDCGTNSTCTNTGTYGYTCTCDLGWRDPANPYRYRGATFPGPATTCGDTDECNGDNCVPNGSCNNTSPGAFCTCNSGFVETGTWQGNDLECESGCSQPSVDCVSTSVCLPDGPPLHFQCDCWDGYTGDGRAPPAGTGCTNIDECATGMPCGIGQAMCNDLTPSGPAAANYACTCLDGYTPGFETCVDIFECDVLNPCNPADPGGVVEGVCTDDRPPAPANQWNCVCAPGFETTGPAAMPTCSDIDECRDPAVSRCSFNATCENLYGSHMCTCNAGYEGDGFNCEDIDECARGLAMCDANASCTNLDGSYRCACNEFYEGSGFACTDIDECARGIGGCGVNERCVNLIGMANEV